VDRYYRPSIDVFFESVAERWKGEAVGVLLTGMGRDGATGLRSIRRAGHLTIAQEASTCVVYGMPKAAIEINGASEILPINKIAQRLANAVSTSHR
jgi:chemotaxis response regulator CheB